MAIASAAGVAGYCRIVSLEPDKVAEINGVLLVLSSDCSCSSWLAPFCSLSIPSPSPNEPAHRPYQPSATAAFLLPAAAFCDTTFDTLLPKSAGAAAPASLLTILNLATRLELYGYLLGSLFIVSAACTCSPASAVGTFWRRQNDYYPGHWWASLSRNSHPNCFQLCFKVNICRWRRHGDHHCALIKVRFSTLCTSRCLAWDSSQQHELRSCTGQRDKQTKHKPPHICSNRAFCHQPCRSIYQRIHSAMKKYPSPPAFNAYAAPQSGGGGQYPAILGIQRIFFSAAAAIFPLSLSAMFSSLSPIRLSPSARDVCLQRTYMLVSQGSEKGKGQARKPRSLPSWASFSLSSPDASSQFVLNIGRRWLRRQARSVRVRHCYFVAS